MIRSLALEKEDGHFWSPTQMLEEALREIHAGERTCTKAVVITLDDADGKYITGFLQSGLSCSQMVALIEVFKHRLFEDMA